MAKINLDSPYFSEYIRFTDQKKKQTNKTKRIYKAENLYFVN